MKKDILSQLLQESLSYRKLEDIEKLVEQGMDLSMIPVQPLYMALRSSSQEQVALVLEKLSSDQRQSLLDIDVWKKDEIDAFAANWWLGVYAHCPSEPARTEFICSEDFLLVLKSQLNIQTFDAEDPQYPESDNYFLTEDGLLLIEYPEDFAFASELRQLIKDLYAELGVEGAYTHLFKMVADSYMTMEEENYQRKKERLRDVGFLDYFDAIEIDSTFNSIEEARKWLKAKKPSLGHIEDEIKNQGLHQSSLAVYQSGMDELKDALESVVDMQRRDYLQFTFIRLVNARIVATDALKAGTAAMSKAGLKAKQCLELGYSFARRQLGPQPVFDYLDFTELYRLGNTLLESQKRKLKRALGGTPFDQDEQEYFLGMWWASFLTHSLEEPVKLKVDGSSAPQEIRSLDQWEVWVENGETFIMALPFVTKFHQTIQSLGAKGEIQNDYYLNYEIETIDFEAIILASLINLATQGFDKTSKPKMGVTIDQLKTFYQSHFQKRGEEWLLKGEEDTELSPLLKRFCEQFGLSAIPRFDRWLKQIMLEQMNGYEIDNMTTEDFKHVGGPIILTQQS